MQKQLREAHDKVFSHMPYPKTGSILTITINKKRPKNEMDTELLTAFAFLDQLTITPDIEIPAVFQSLGKILVPPQKLVGTRLERELWKHKLATDIVLDKEVLNNKPIDQPMRIHVLENEQGKGYSTVIMALITLSSVLRHRDEKHVFHWMEARAGEIGKNERQHQLVNLYARCGYSLVSSLPTYPYLVIDNKKYYNVVMGKIIDVQELLRLILQSQTQPSIP